MQIGVASSSSVGIPVLQELLASHHKISFVLTNPEKKAGRGQENRANDFHSYAVSQGIEVLTPDSSAELYEILKDRDVDSIVTIAYGQLIKPDSLAIPKYGWLNIHFSELPRWRGASPIQSAILAGDNTTGISIFQLDKGMDTGPIFSAETEQILDSDTTESLLERLSEKAAKAISSLLDQIADGTKPVQQSEVGITHAGKFSKMDGALDVHGDCDQFLRKIRALGANPGTFITFRGERLRIAEATRAAQVLEDQPVASLLPTKKNLFLKLSDGYVELTRVTPAGKKLMSGADFSRGARIESGESVE